MRIPSKIVYNYYLLCLHGLLVFHMIIINYVASLASYVPTRSVDITSLTLIRHFSLCI